jgi:hypothetical protein
MTLSAEGRIARASPPLFVKATQPRATRPQNLSLGPAPTVLIEGRTRSSRASANSSMLVAAAVIEV